MRLSLLLLLWVLATAIASANRARLPDNPYLSLEINFDGENIKSTESPIEFTGTWSGRSLHLSGEGRILVDARGSNPRIRLIFVPRSENFVDFRFNGQKFDLADEWD